MTQFDLSGQKAIVTGGTRGLGLGMADGLLAAGAEVVVTGSGQSAEVVARARQADGLPCHGVGFDLAVAAARADGFDRALSALEGRVDILVNAAGIQRRHPAESFPLDDWTEVIDVNLTAVFHMCRLAGEVMLEQGRGKIVNIASLLSFFGGMTVPAYAASKGGVMQLTRALSNEWAARGINVNAIAPGYMATDMNTALLADAGRNAEITARIPAARWGNGADMAGPVVFLASPASDYVHGAILPVDGGYLGR